MKNIIKLIFVVGLDYVVVPTIEELTETFHRS